MVCYKPASKPWEELELALFISQSMLILVDLLNEARPVGDPAELGKDGRVVLRPPAGHRG